MATVNFTTQEFTSRLDQAFDLADKGEKVIIRRGRRRAYRLIPFTEEPSDITPELQAKIDQAREEYRRGETLHFESKEEMDQYFDSL